MLKTQEINIRDPYIMNYEGKYYLYGTRSITCWGPAEGFDCYVSEDLENWEGPIEIFSRPEDFFATQNYWAPECYAINDEFYFFTTFGGEGIKKGIYVLKASSPTGPFSVFSERITPDNWSCIDGTLYFEEGIPHLIFSHSFEDTPDGDMCLLELTPDLSKAVGEPKTLFSAADTSWAKPVPFAESEFGMKGEVYFTDGPCAMKMPSGELYMTWSSWGTKGYAVGVATSDTGSIHGPWQQVSEPIFPENGGHGMMFKANDKEKATILFTIHFPNDKYQERPCFFRVYEENGEITLGEKISSSHQIAN